MEGLNANDYDKVIGLVDRYFQAMTEQIGAQEKKTARLDQDLRQSIDHQSKVMREGFAETNSVLREMSKETSLALMKLAEAQAKSDERHLHTDKHLDHLYSENKEIRERLNNLEDDIDKNTAVRRVGVFIAGALVTAIIAGWVGATMFNKPPPKQPAAIVRKD